MRNHTYHFLLAIVVMLSRPASACDCGSKPELTRAKNAKIAVTVKAETSPSGSKRIVVQHRFRGDPPDVIELRANMSDCARAIEPGKEYLWLTDVSPDTMKKPITITKCEYLEIESSENKALKWLVSDEKTRSPK